MKKKIILLVAALMIFATGVSASSLNGDYRGNPIVLVKSDGKTLQADEVPGQILDGHTMVPISMLRQLGASVTWDQNTYSVNVNIPTQQTTNTADSIKVVYDEVLKNGASYFKVSYDGIGAYAEVNYTLTGNDLVNIANIALLSLKTDATEVWVTTFSGNTMAEKVKIFKKDIEDFKNGTINRQQFQNNWSYKDLATNTTPSAPTLPATPSTSTSSVIESKIDGDFEGWDGDKIYKLDNGQIWEQDDYQYHYHYKYHPAVMIYKDGMSYYMIVTGFDDKVKVKRIK